MEHDVNKKGAKEVDDIIHWIFIWLAVFVEVI
jgi:hypothetical protein